MAPDSEAVMDRREKQVAVGLLKKGRICPILAS
jgi:hypothetical protein